MTEFIVLDLELDQAIGPFQTEDEARAWIDEEAKSIYGKPLGPDELVVERAYYRVIPLYSTEHLEGKVVPNG
jgi:hypothetical protein